MKRVFLLFLALTCVAFLFGCDQKTAPEQDSAIPQGESGNNDGSFCTLSIDCSAVLQRDGVDPAILDSLPDDGVIFARQEVAFSDGESVADVLRRVCRENKIPVDMSVTPGNGSIYVKAISNLREFDGGPGSGWLYRVNGTECPIASSEYRLSAGDRVEWRYSCEFGDDIEWGTVSR